MNKIRLKAEGAELVLEVRFLDNPAARKILESLPLKSKANIWGDEIYFDIGFATPVANATMDVAVGDIAYWPEGKCLCIFFGRTPASSGNKPVPASEVVVVGKASVDPASLRKVKSGSGIIVE
jgi:hypothetical protein